MITIEEFVAKYKINGSFRRVDKNPNLDDDGDYVWAADHWRCTFKRSGTNLSVTWYFSMGSGHNGRVPSTEEVIDCIASDSSAVQSCRDVAEFLIEYDYIRDAGSVRRGQRIWNQIVQQDKELKAFLGDEAYEELLWETERQ